MQTIENEFVDALEFSVWIIFNHVVVVSPCSLWKTQTMDSVFGLKHMNKIEGIFKALARALKMAVKRDIYKFELPSTKGML